MKSFADILQPNTPRSGALAIAVKMIKEDCSLHGRGACFYVIPLFRLPEGTFLVEVPCAKQFEWPRRLHKGLRRAPFVPVEALTDVR